MASDPPWRFIVIAEDRLGAENATLLADRVMQSMPSDWTISTELDHLRHWTGVEDHESFTPLSSLSTKNKRTPGGFNQGLHGRFPGESTLADSRQTRLAILRFKMADPAAQLLVIARDSDGDGDRRKGFREACEVRGSPPDVVLALMEPAAESWRLRGYKPETPVESEKIEAHRKSLGFDPTTRPHEFPNGPEGRRLAKRTLEALTEANQERSLRTLDIDLAGAETDTDDQTGRAEYLGDVRTGLRALRNAWQRPRP